MKKEKKHKKIPEIRKTFRATRKLKSKEIEELIVKGFEENL